MTTSGGTGSRPIGRCWRTPYAQGHSAWQQSGFGLHTPRNERAWRALRRPVVDSLLDGLSSAQRAQPVNFLDVGCANGYLLECSQEWAREAGVALIPWGLDISEKLAALARRRLPAYASHISVGNVWSWIPPRRFDALRAELIYVPEPLRKRFVARLLDEFLLDDGLLLVAEYAGHTPDGETLTLTIDEQLRAWGYSVVSVQSGAWEGAECTRVAAIRR